MSRTIIEAEKHLVKLSHLLSVSYGNDTNRILVDTGADDVPQYITQLRHVLKNESCTVSDVVVTHWHADHLGGLPHVLGNLPPASDNSKLHITTRFNVQRTLLTLLAFADRGCRVWKHPGSGQRQNDDQNKPKVSELTDGQTLSVEGATLRAVYTPGHSDDHVVLLLEEENALLSGDCVLGEGTAVFENLYDYMRSLHRILELQPAVIYPGHGNVVLEPLEKIRWYLKHRTEREKQILMVLEAATEPLNPLDIVRSVYTDTPERMFPAAEVNVRHHLEKLVKENKVVCTSNDKFTCRITT